MPTVIESSVFSEWFSALKDRTVRARIAVRIDRLAAGNQGDHKGVGDGVMEMRMTFGAGYRVYYMHQGDVVVVLLIGGDKSTQNADIAKAKSVAATWRR